MSNANSVLLTVTASAMLLLVPGAVHAGNAQIWWSEPKEPQLREQAEREGPRRDVARRARAHQYVTDVQAQVERYWAESARGLPGEEAFVMVMIDGETGKIQDSTVQGCSGSAEFCDSVTEAMNQLQYLPRPPDPDMVRGGVRIRFAPD